jgi:hypothetical protein
MIDLLIAVVFGALVTVAWLLRFGPTQDRSPHQSGPSLVEAQHRVSDTGEREVRDA